MYYSNYYNSEYRRLPFTNQNIHKLDFSISQVEGKLKRTDLSTTSSNIAFAVIKGVRDSDSGIQGVPSGPWAPPITTLNSGYIISSTAELLPFICLPSYLCLSSKT